MSDDCFSPATVRMIQSNRNKSSNTQNERLQPTATASASSSADDGKGSNVQVIVRCRPPTEVEKKMGDVVLGCVNENEVRINANIKGKPLAKTYTFDQSFGQLATQDDVYNNAVKPLVDEVLAGFNCTVFAYGQTGTGKTYTMEGQLTAADQGKGGHAGVIPRSVHTIFDQLEKQHLESSVKVSFLELYNEELSDLLSEEDENGDHKELRIFEDQTGKRGMLVNNLEEIIVNNASDVFALMQKSWQKRRTAETLLNKNSSRSHCVFTITVHTKEYNEDGEDIIKSGKLYLVDLAGSECVGKSGAQNQRAKEAGKINQSLLTLGRVINALVDKAGYVPYRDSKLTRLLQESLGGRAKTVIIATVSPSANAIDETMSTLEYAHRAKNIRNRPQVNQKMTKRAYMKELLDEINSLKRENECLRLKNGIYLAPEKYESLMMEQKGKTLMIEEYLYSIKAKENELKELTDLLTDKDSKISQVTEEKTVIEATLAATTVTLDQTKLDLLNKETELLHTRINLGANKLELILTQKDLNNSRFIATAHATTEGRLHQDIEKIVNTLDKILVDKNRLHDKIDRKNSVESLNQQANQRLRERTQSAAKQAKENYEEFADKQRGQLEAIQEQIRDSHKPAYDSAMASIASQLRQFEADTRANQSALAEGQQEQQRRQQTAHQRIDEHTSAATEAAIGRVSAHYSSNKAHVAKTRELLAGPVAAADAALKEAVKQGIQHAHNNAAQFAGALKSDLKEHASHQEAAHSSLVSSLSAHSTLLSSFLSSQAAHTRQLTAGLMASVGQLVQQYEQECQAHINNGLQQLAASIAAAQASSAESARRDLERQADLASKTQQFESLEANAFTALSHQCESLDQRVADARSLLSSECALLSTSLLEQQAVDLSAAHDAQQATNALIKAAQQVGDESHGKQMALISEADRLLSTAFAGGLDELAAVGERTADAFTGISDALGLVEATLAANGPVVQGDLVALQQPVSQYIGVDYRVDVPTGQTPVKAPLEYARLFPATAAHADLIKLYRNKPENNSEPIPEADELIQLATANGALLPHSPLVIAAPLVNSKTAAIQMPDFDSGSARKHSEAESTSEIADPSPVTVVAEPISVPVPAAAAAAAPVAASAPAVDSAVSTRRVAARSRNKSLNQMLAVVADEDADPIDVENVVPNLPASGPPSTRGSAASKAFGFNKNNASKIRPPSNGEAI